MIHIVNPSPTQLAILDKLPSNINRSSLIHSLLCSLNLNLIKIPLIPASSSQLGYFHSDDYIDFLLNPNLKDASQFGLLDDSPIFPELPDYAKLVAGSTLSATNALKSGCKIAINWDGGRHHAKQDEAAGFCYVNDIVIGILDLSPVFKRILYIDLDIHHGDAVQQAFYYSNNVFTLSFHRLDLGFYPGSGLIDEIGCGKGKGFCKNVPLKPGLSSRLYIEIFHEIFNKINMTFNPDLLVVQCGADGLAKDKKVPKPDAWNLDASAFVEIILHLKQTGIPILVLGGGGYNHVNTAKTWALMTMALDGADVPDMIPDNDPFIEEYAPDFSFDLEVSYRIDENLKVVDGKRYIDGIVDGVLLES